MYDIRVNTYILLSEMDTLLRALELDEPYLLQFVELPSDVYDDRVERQSPAAELLADALYQGAGNVALTLADFYGIGVLAEAATYLARIVKSRGKPAIDPWRLVFRSDMLQEELKENPQYLQSFIQQSPDAVRLRSIL